ncbi:hypothetical protein [Clostridium magnum]|uniref:Uncharacterized protein n=1 Tax=Clostridium magnum DSM 2767 TaxID=1121326 RepID=A0A162S2K5_9CLOT|nr:hypothetical protein [Clostridium magnum]KZL90694.1 hypothetical protein CLMAG_35950 [Clostridium magnum DSM 2767]SHI40536.1 hypothetical protein SAMN02745944_04261 [Clostridium magnum DSM 2767]
MKEYYRCIKEYIGSVNMAVKSLIIIGFIALAETILTIFFDPYNQTSPTDVSIRSVMSSIFGFIFGAQTTENSNITSKKLQTFISCTVAIICLLTSVAVHWLNVNQTGASAVEIRNLLFASVGFLLSRAKE